MPGILTVIRSAIRKSLRLFGVDLIRFPPRDEKAFPDFQREELAVIRAVRPWTMTSPERIYSLIQAVRYVSTNNIAGDIVECGVWKGGSMAAAAMTLAELGDTCRDLWLFDTFEGMSEPTAEDTDYSGAPGSEVLKHDPWCKCADAPIEQVQKVLYETGYPKDRMRFIKGRVEETLPLSAPEAISLLRLDTDWYESTIHELKHLFPRLAKGGVIIIDDYGHWRGARRACDEYFSEWRVPILLHRIDYTGRIGLKP